MSEIKPIDVLGLGLVAVDFVAARRVQPQPVSEIGQVLGFFLLVQIDRQSLAERHGASYRVMQSLANNELSDIDSRRDVAAKAVSSTVREVPDDHGNLVHASVTAGSRALKKST